LDRVSTRSLQKARKDFSKLSRQSRGVGTKIRFLVIFNKNSANFDKIQLISTDFSNHFFCTPIFALYSKNEAIHSNGPIPGPFPSKFQQPRINVEQHDRLRRRKLHNAHAASRQPEHPRPRQTQRLRLLVHARRQPQFPRQIRPC